MSLRADIQTALRAANDAIGESWYYRRRTSGATGSKTYGTWTSVTVNATSRILGQEWDDKRGAFKSTNRMKARISDAVSELEQGDQLKDPAGVVYAVMGVAAQAANTGTLAYEIARDVTMRGEAGPGRDGGL